MEDTAAEQTTAFDAGHLVEIGRDKADHKAVRESIGVTQIDLANLLGVTVRTINVGSRSAGRSRRPRSGTCWQTSCASTSASSPGWSRAPRPKPGTAAPKVKTPAASRRP